MLSYDRLENIARLKRLTIINAEKDYLQDLILFSIYSQLGRELVFKGGTCLYKIYKLNRFSEDLDFTLIKEIKIKEITDKLISDLMLLNIGGRVKEIKEHRNQINVRLLLNGPLYKGDKQAQCFIPLNISMKEQIIYESQREFIVSMYEQIPNFEIFVMEAKEILAEKIRAIFMRTKPRDVYDLWFLLIQRKVEFNISLVNKKLKLNNLKFDFKILKKRIEKTNSLWNSDLKNLVIGELEEFNKVKKEILEKLRNKL